MRFSVAALAVALCCHAASAAQADDVRLLADIEAQVRSGNSIGAVATHIEDIDRAVSGARPGSDGPYPRLALYAARYNLSLSRAANAIRDLDWGLAAAARDNPLQADLFILRANALQTKMRWVEAAAAYDNALARPDLDDAQKAQIQRGRGFLLDAIGRHDDALTAWRTALALEPGDPEATAAITAMANRPVNAITVQARPSGLMVPPPPPPPPPSPTAPNQPPRDAGHTHNCASFYPAHSRDIFESGVATLRYDVAADGTIGNVAVTRSSNFARLDEAAVACLRTRWKDVPATKDGVPVAAPGMTVSIRFFVPLPNAPQELVARGNGFEESGRVGRAIEDFDAAIALNPDYAPAYAARALAWDSIGQGQRATADRAKAVVLSKVPVTP